MAADVAGDADARPSSFCTSFMAAKIGRSGQPMQKPGGRGGTVLASSLIFGSASTVGSVRRRRRVAEQLWRVQLEKRS